MFILRIITENIMYSVYTHDASAGRHNDCGALITGFVRKSRSDVKQLRRVLGNRNDYCYPIKNYICVGINMYIFRSEAELRRRQCNAADRRKE